MVVTEVKFTYMNTVKKVYPPIKRGEEDTMLIRTETDDIIKMEKEVKDRMWRRFGAKIKNITFCF